jgi:putative MATE family efflux protein
VAGSALSTIIANTVAAIICFFVWRTHHLAEIAPFRFQLHWETLKKIIAVGFPLSLQMLIVSSSFLFIFSLANGFGTNVTAAFGICTRVDQFAFMATFAVSAAISAMTAQNFGAGRVERIARITRWGVILSFVMSLFFTAAVLIFPDAITSLFTSDAAVTSFTRNYFRIAGLSYLAISISFAYQGVLRGAGDTIASFLMIACSMIFLRVPLCYLLSHFTPLRETGLWLGITVSSFGGTAAFYWYYTSGKWKNRGTRVAVSTQAIESSSMVAPELLQTEEPF